MCEHCELRGLIERCRWDKLRPRPRPCPAPRDSQYGFTKGLIIEHEQTAA